MKINSKQQLLESNKSMSLWRPFKPASYNNYSECMRALYKQGTPMSFFKGNLTRSIHILMFHKLNTWMAFSAEAQLGQTWKKMKDIPCLTEFLLSCSVDMVLQPLHVAETRITMQNRTSNFAIYRNLRSYFSTTPVREMFRGVLVHMPRNFLIALSGMKI